MKKLTHTHHILPKHAGGSNSKNNLIELSIDEHAEAHKILWETYGKWQDYCAWQLLSNQMTRDNFKSLMTEKTAQHCKSIAHLGGIHNKNKKHCYNPETGESNVIMQSGLVVNVVISYQ